MVLGKNLIYLCLLFSMGACTNNSKTKVGLQVLGNFENALLDTVSNAISNIYGFDVVILPVQEIPQSSYTKVKSPRYRADKIIKILKDTKNDSISYVLGLVENDISTTKRDKDGKALKPKSRYEDWGIFGLGYRPGVSSVVSTFRIKNTKRFVFVERLKKICIHELGHNMGLEHCKNKKCVMTDAAESIKTIDQVALKLCDECLEKLN